MNTKSARFYALISMIAAIVTIALKFGAYLLTDSIGLFSDAAESMVNLLAAVVAFWALTLAARPPDDEHMYGHSKAEYFASGLEGALVIIAAVSIAVTAWSRLLDPQPLESVGLGLGVSLLATTINGGVAMLLFRAGSRLRSVTLNADARHLMTDVWTTGGVVVGVLLVQLTGWLILDPLIAIAVAVNVVWTGVRLLRETGYALLDTALSADDTAIIMGILAKYQERGILFHAMRTRQAGPRRFVSLHVLVPGTLTVQQGHDICEELELTIQQALAETNVMTHLEPLEDPTAWEDLGLDRAAKGEPAAAAANHATH